MGNASTKKREVERKKKKLDLITFDEAMSLYDRGIKEIRKQLRRNSDEILLEINDSIRKYFSKRSKKSPATGVNFDMDKSLINANVPKDTLCFNDETYLEIIQEVLNERLEKEGTDWTISKVKNKENGSSYRIGIAFVFPEKEEEESSSSS